MSVPDRDAATPTFAPLDDRDGLEIVDPIERVRFELYTARPVEPAPASTDPFPFPMDSAVTVQTGRIDVPRLADVMIREADGEFLTDYSTAEDREVVPAGAYDLGLSSTPLKLHLLVESAVEIRKTSETSTAIEFGERTTVTVGARSFHDRPAGTITVPDDPEALMDAVSLFGSALKTTGPERSFPTMRGHPPRLEQGDHFRVSKGIDAPDTGVEIGVPPERKAVYAVAPLAFYLGARVEPAERPRLATDETLTFFPRPSREYGWYREADDFEASIHRTLKQVFFLDCVVREEGFHPMGLVERAAFEERTTVDFDAAALYELSPAERLEAYLEVPYGEVYPFLPTWSQLVDVVPAPGRDQLLPYLVNDLSLVRCTPPSEKRHLRPNDDLSIEIHGKQEPTEPPNAEDPNVHDMSYAGKTFDPAPTDAVEHAHVGDGYPKNSNKLRLKAFENRITDDRDDGPTVKVHVVSNDEQIDDIGLLPSVYGDRNLLDFEVSYDSMVSRRQLKEILEKPTDLVHFVGEATDEGLVCTNGVLEPFEVYPLQARTLLVQECTDYGDLEWFIDRGGFGAVAIASEIYDPDDALVVGRWMARLLNRGFTLNSAMEITNQRFDGKLEYVVLGDGGYAVTQAAGERPNVLDIESTECETYEMTITSHLSRAKSIGGSFWPNLDGHRDDRLAPKEYDPIELSREELIAFLKLEPVPVHYQGEYLWSDLLKSSDF